MTDAELAFQTGALFNRKITDAFWDSFKGELGRVQAEVLVYLHDHEPAQASDIGDALNISKQHVSKIISGFIGSGYVDHQTNEADKRSVSLALTEKGREYLARHFAISGCSFECLLQKMNDAEKKQFRDAMDVISDLLSKC